MAKSKKQRIEAKLATKRGKKAPNGVTQSTEMAQLQVSETAMDSVLARLSEINGKLKAKPPKKVNTRDLPKLALLVAEKC